MVLLEVICGGLCGGGGVGGGSRVVALLVIAAPLASTPLSRAHSVISRPPPSIVKRS